MTTPRIEEIKAEFQMFVPEDDGSAMDWLENRLEETHQAGIDEAVEIFERFIEDIPEAYGWGEEDKEADRGYQICSKNVKVMGRKALKALQEYKVRV